MKNLTYILIGLLLFNSCGQDKTSEEKAVIVQNEEKNAVTESVFKILSEVPTKYGKCNIDIELKEKISKDELTSIANKIRETRKSYDNLWVFYYLPGMKVGSGAWATTHFTPNLEVKIIGATEEEEKKINDVTVDGNVIGKWQVKQLSYEYIIIIYEKNKNIFCKGIYTDGSSSDEEYVKKKYKGKVRYEAKQNKHNEYYLIEDNGNLGMYGENGKFCEGTKKD